MDVYKMTEKHKAGVINLRNWALWLAKTCQDDLDDDGLPPDGGDNYGVETQACFFLANAKEHFLKDVVELDEGAEEHNDEVCPFCGLEEEDGISDPRDVLELSEVITPWAAGLDKS